MGTLSNWGPSERSRLVSQKPRVWASVTNASQAATAPSPVGTREITGPHSLADGWHLER